MTFVVAAALLDLATAKATQMVENRTLTAAQVALLLDALKPACTQVSVIEDGSLFAGVKALVPTVQAW